MIALGDVQGYVTLYTCRHDPHADRRAAGRFQITRKWRIHVHTDLVTGILHVPELGSVLTSSLDTRLAICDGELRCGCSTVAAVPLPHQFLY